MNQPASSRRRFLRPVELTAITGLVLLAVAAVLHLRGADQQSSPVAAPEPAPSTSTSSTPTNPTPPVSQPGATSSPTPSSTTRAPAGSARDQEWISAREVDAAKKAARGAPERAEKMMRLLAQARGLGYATWWSRTEGLLSEQGRTEVVGIDPEQVPFRRVTGHAQLVLSEEPSSADGHGDEEVTVAVPTDVGAWNVLLTQDPDSGAWLVSSIRAPEGVH